MAKKSYFELLKDPRWQRKRLEILNRSDFACENCQSTDKTLHVHHKLYRKGAMPWEYEDHELQALCENCHEDQHAVRAALDAILARLAPDKIETVLGYAEGQLALEEDWKLLDNREHKVRSYQHASGMLDALWEWNGGGSKPDPCCMCDHGTLDDRLFCALGEGEMPPPQGGV